MIKKLIYVAITAVSIGFLFINVIYAVNKTNISKNPKKLNTYIIENSEVTVNSAMHFADIFNMKENFLEYDEYFLFYGEYNDKLKVYKYLNYIMYENDSKARNKPIDGNGDALNLALSFIDNLILFFAYDEAVVDFDGQFYNIKFISLLDNIKLYSFNNSITIDTMGNIVKMEYYYNKFKQLSNISLKTIDEALKSIPSNINIDTERIAIVYTYENSIVQPSYLFIGEDTTGNVCKYFISAAQFS